MSNVIIDCNTATHMYVDFTAYNMYFSLLPLVSTKIITFERIFVIFLGGNKQQKRNDYSLQGLQQLLKVCCRQLGTFLRLLKEHKFDKMYAK